MDEIVEGTVGTLHILAREAQSRSSIRALKCMPLFVQVTLLTYRVLLFVNTSCHFIINFYMYFYFGVGCNIFKAYKWYTSERGLKYAFQKSVQTTIFDHQTLIY